VALLVAKHAKAAQERCPTLKNKTVSPHVLRHSAAMSLLRSGVDITVIAMWLGHFSGVPKLCRSVARRPFFSEE
jgi:site-specific recombinase XerD